MCLFVLLALTDSSSWRFGKARRGRGEICLSYEVESEVVVTLESVQVSMAPHGNPMTCYTILVYAHRMSREGDSLVVPDCTSKRVGTYLAQRYALATVGCGDECTLLV